MAKMICNSSERKFILLHLHKSLFLIIPIITFSLYLPASDKNTSQTQSVCTSNLLRDNTENHLHEIQLFKAIISDDYNATQATLQALLQNKANLNPEFTIYEEPDESLKISLQYMQATDPNTILIPKPTDTPLDRLFHLYNINLINATALHIAIVIGNPLIVRLLVTSKAEINTTDTRGLTALELLVYQEQFDSRDIKLIVKSFIDRPLEDNEVIAKVYHRAAMRKNVPVAAALVKYAKDLIPKEMIHPRHPIRDLILFMYPQRDIDITKSYRWMLQQLARQGLIELKPSFFEGVFER